MTKMAKSPQAAIAPESDIEIKEKKNLPVDSQGNVDYKAIARKGSPKKHKRKNDKPSTMLVQAARSGNVNDLASLIEQKVDACAVDGHTTALMVASKQGHIEVGYLKY